MRKNSDEEAKSEVRRIRREWIESRWQGGISGTVACRVSCKLRIHNNSNSASIIPERSFSCFMIRNSQALLYFMTH